MPYLKPSEIYFSHDSIYNVFGNYCQHRGIHIGSTLDRLCEGRMTVSDIPPIGVMQKGGRWYTGDNRRLWIFRELERLGKCTNLFVISTYVPAKKFTTHNRGEFVRVRGDPGGSWYLRSASSTHREAMSSYRTQSNNPIKTASYRHGEDPMSKYSICTNQPRSTLSRHNPTNEIQPNPFYHRPTTASAYNTSNEYPTTYTCNSHWFRQYEPRSTSLFRQQQQQSPSKWCSSTRSSGTDHNVSTRSLRQLQRQKLNHRFWGRCQT